MAKAECKVGETFQFGLKTLKCVEGTSCKRCMFDSDMRMERVYYINPKRVSLY